MAQLLSPAPRDELVPDAATIFGWIERVFAQGVRRPGSPADRWAEVFAAERFRELKLERVRLEPVEVPSWEPRAWTLDVRGKGGGWEPLPCFPLPFSAPCEGLEAELVPFAADAPERVAGRASLVDAPLLRLPPAFAIGAGTPGAGGLADEERVVDPEGSLDGA